MNIQKILLGMVLMASVSGVAIFASDADLKSGADILSFSGKDLNIIKNKEGKIIGIDYTAEQRAQIDARYSQNLPRIENSLKNLNKQAPVKPHDNSGLFSSISTETWNKLIFAGVSTLVTGVLTISWEWARSSKKDVQARRTALEYANLETKDRVLRSQYGDIKAKRIEIASLRKLAVTKDTETRKKLLDRCDKDEIELNEMECNLNEKIFEFMKIRDQFLKNNLRSDEPVQDAKQVLTQQASAKKIEAAPAA